MAQAKAPAFRPGEAPGTGGPLRRQPAVRRVSGTHSARDPSDPEPRRNGAPCATQVAVPG